MKIIDSGATRLRELVVVEGYITSLTEVQQDLGNW